MANETLRSWHNFSQSWQEYRDIKIVPSYGGLRPPSFWERIGKALKNIPGSIAHPSWAPGTILRKQKGEVIGEVSNIEEDFNSIISSRWDMPPEKVAIELQKKGYSEEESIEYVNKKRE